MASNKVFGIFQFSKDQALEVVPLCWVTEDEQSCFWPRAEKKIQSHKMAEMIQKAVPVNEKWGDPHTGNLLKKYRTFTKASTKCDEFTLGGEEPESSTAGENTNIPSKRTSRKSQKVIENEETEAFDAASKDSVVLKRNKRTISIPILPESMGRRATSDTSELIEFSHPDPINGTANIEHIEVTSEEQLLSPTICGDDGNGFKFTDEQDFDQGDGRNVMSSPAAVAASTTEGKSAPAATVFTTSSSPVTQATNSNSSRIPRSYHRDRTLEQIDTVNTIERTSAAESTQQRVATAIISAASSSVTRVTNSNSSRMTSSHTIQPPAARTQHNSVRPSGYIEIEKVEKFLLDILTKLELLSTNQRNHGGILEVLLKQYAAQPDKSSKGIKEELALPANNATELKNIETKLKDTTTKSRLVAHLSCKGGSTLANAISRAMVELMTYECGEMFCYAGQNKDKEAFIELKNLKQVIIDGVRGQVEYSTAKDKQIESGIQNFLKKAPGNVIDPETGKPRRLSPKNPKEKSSKRKRVSSSGTCSSNDS